MRRTVTLIALVSAALASGCGQAQSGQSGGSTAPELTNLAQVVSATRDARTARIALTTRTQGPTGTTTVRATGVVALTRPVLGSMAVSIHVPTVPVPIQMDEIVDGLVAYMEIPALSQEMSSARPWLKLDLGQLGKKAGIDFGSLMSAGDSDPTQALDYLSGTSTGLRSLGSADIRGAQTTHYRATVDLRKVVAHAPAANRAALKASISTLERELGGTVRYPVDVWIDSTGRLRRISERMKMPALTQTMFMTEDLYGFGTPVDVTPPPADQTTDYFTFMRKLAKQHAQVAP